MTVFTGCSTLMTVSSQGNPVMFVRAQGLLVSEFDEGALNEDPENARKEVEALVTLMKGGPSLFLYRAEEYPLRYVFQSVWHRIAKVSSSNRRTASALLILEYQRSSPGA